MRIAHRLAGRYPCPAIDTMRAPRPACAMLTAPLLPARMPSSSHLCQQRQQHLIASTPLAAHLPLLICSLPPPAPPQRTRLTLLEQALETARRVGVPNRYLQVSSQLLLQARLAKRCLWVAAIVVAGLVLAVTVYILLMRRRHSLAVARHE